MIQTWRCCGNRADHSSLRIFCDVDAFVWWSGPVLRKWLAGSGVSSRARDQVTPKPGDALGLEIDDLSADIARRHRLEALLSHVGDPADPVAQLALPQTRTEPVRLGAEVLLAGTELRMSTLRSVFMPIVSLIPSGSPNGVVRIVVVWDVASDARDGGVWLKTGLPQSVAW